MIVNFYKTSSSNSTCIGWIEVYIHKDYVNEHRAFRISHDIVEFEEKTYHFNSVYQITETLKKHFEEQCKKMDAIYQVHTACIQYRECDRINLQDIDTVIKLMFDTEPQGLISAVYEGCLKDVSGKLKMIYYVNSKDFYTNLLLE